MLFDLLTMSIDPSSIQVGAFPIVEMGNHLRVHLDITTHGLTLAQQFQDVDVVANLRNGWDDFLKTGKAGALAVGLVAGYMIRGITR